MNSVRQYCLSLWAISLLAGASAAQVPAPAFVWPPAVEDDILALPTFPLLQISAQVPVVSVPPIAAAAGAPVPLPTSPLVSEIFPSSIGTDAASMAGSGWFAGAGLYVLQPYFEYNPAYTVFVENTIDTTLDPTNPTTRNIGEFAQRTAVKHHISAAPLVWLGYMNEEGFGVRVRGWAFQQGTSQTVNLPPFAGRYAVSTSGGQTVIVSSGSLSTVTSAAPLGLMAFGDTLSLQNGPESTSFNVTTKLAMQVGDLDALRRVQVGEWTVVAAGGIRYVRIDQEYNAYDAQSSSPAALRTLLSTYTFQGVGPTIAFELRRALGETGVSLYSQCRGAVVFGPANQQASFSGQILRNDDPNPQFASESRNRGIPILDLEAGLEHGRAVGGNWVFGQVALVGQQWFKAGSASRSTMLTPPNVARPVLGGAPLDTNIAFLGLTFRLGLNY